MNHPDDVFEAFVKANPAPDVAVLAAERLPAERFLTVLERGGVPMTDIRDTTDTDDTIPTIGTTEPTRPTVRPRRQLLVAAAAFAIVLLGGAFVLVQLLGSGEAEPAAPPDSREAVEADALAKVDAWMGAFNAGEVDVVVTLSDPGARELADVRMYEFNGVFGTNGMTTDVESCATPIEHGTTAIVECTVIANDPVIAAVGPARGTFPFRYADGLLTWMPAEGLELSETSRAYVEYLQAFHPDDYDRVCSPEAYEPNSAVVNRGLALTGPCAEVLVPLAETIAQWIGDGKPQP